MFSFFSDWRDQRQIEYIEKTRHLPFEKLKKGGWRRVLTASELDAVKWWVVSVQNVRIDSPYYQNAMRNIIVCGNICGIKREFKKCSDNVSRVTFLRNGFDFMRQLIR